FASCGGPSKKGNDKGERPITNSSAKEQSFENTKINTLDSIPLQTFNVDIAGDDEMVIGEKRSCYILPKNCFLDENGKPVNRGITVELRELNAMQDFIKGGISTMSNGKLLCTGGSYYFNAKANGKNLKINPAVKPVGLFPGVKKGKDMGFLKGK
ncbi:MAG TPA: hypothetical protein VD905_11800, partial [Flavobacteriales bacterium]|nr:hypothetical protein [Flavobacteriales bacterium]